MKKIMLMLLMLIPLSLSAQENKGQKRYGTLRLVNGTEITGEYIVDDAGDYMVTDANGDVFVFGEREIKKIKGGVKVAKMSYPRFEQNVEFSTGGLMHYLFADVNYTFGWRLVKWLYVGVGVGFDFLPICGVHGGLIYDYLVQNDSANAYVESGSLLAEPAFNGQGYVQLRTYFKKKRKTMPFLSLSFGGYSSIPFECTYCIKPDNDWQSDGDKVSYPVGGMMGNALFGLDWSMNSRSSFYLAFGAQARQLWKVTEYTEGKSFSARQVFSFAPSLNFGFTF